jgi:hypothetical protein
MKIVQVSDVHIRNHRYYMVIPAGAKYPTPVWGEELEIVRKA